MAVFDSTKSGSGVSPIHPVGELLGAIWQDALQCPSIGIDDNFFDLGGNAAAADRMFARIAQECGRELPSATIYHASTISALAAVLENPTPPRFSPFVQLKAGTKGPPILIAHGLDGRARFSGLAKCIPTGQPVYGIHGKGLDGLEEPFDRIEDMAQFYLDALNDLQPQGPYILIGYSFGGLVALEMAQRLSANGKSVALLALVDTYPHPRHLTMDQRLRLGARRGKRHISEMRRRSIGSAIRYVFDGLKKRLGIGSRKQSTVLTQGSRLSLARTTVQVKAKARVALSEYRPLPYRGKICFVKRENDPYFPGASVPVWAHLAEAFEVRNVPGGHLNVITAHYQSLAAVLTDYVNQALGQG
jgi:acetoacetyl-CoA synthetase